MPIEERLDDADRQLLLRLLYEQVPATLEKTWGAGRTTQILRLIARLSGTDTVVKVERAYLSHDPERAPERDPAIEIARNYLATVGYDGVRLGSADAILVCRQLLLAFGVEPPATP